MALERVSLRPSNFEEIEEGGCAEQAVALDARPGAISGHVIKPGMQVDQEFRIDSLVTKLGDR